MIIPVILSGGSGQRLWPLSRSSYPKQYLKLTNKKYSLLQDTILRVSDPSLFTKPIIICNEEHRFLVKQQISEINTTADIILEPTGKNTAPAIAIASEFVKNNIDINKNNLLILPADHYIGDVSIFIKAVKSADELAQKNKLVTFGIRPTSAKTGYGYIQPKNNSSDINKFVEKPNKETAKEYLKSGDYYWNSGMFLLSSKLYLQELEKLEPEIYKISKQAVINITKDLSQDFNRISLEDYIACPNISIDYAVMEKTAKAAVVPVESELNWSDVGSWDSIWELAEKDNITNNHHVGDVLSINSKNNLVYAANKTVATLGVENLIIIETKDAVLVADKNNNQSIKELVTKLKEKQPNLIDENIKVNRPWGWFESISIGERFQVKHIFVDPNKSLSLQMHNHRSEHWVIVKGTAKITKGEEEFLLTENQSVYIPVGVKHRLENVGKIPLELIEVQSGSYLGEDDIIRFQDEHGRVTV